MMRAFFWVMTVQSTVSGDVRTLSGTTTVPWDQSGSRLQLFTELRGQVSQQWPDHAVVFWSVEPNEL